MQLNNKLKFICNGIFFLVVLISIIINITLVDLHKVYEYTF